MENLNTKQKIIIGVIAIAMVLTIGYYFIQEFTSQEPEFETLEEAQNETQTEKLEKEIKVHVAGCVEEEGIFTLKEGDRIADAIDAAGGLTSDANIKDINLAYTLKDGQKIYIPSNIEEEVAYVTSQTGEQIITSGSSNEEASASGKININTATQTELETLSGIGPSTAQKIIDYRNTNGDFENIEDIKNVPGIGDAKFESIKDSIEV